MELKRAAIKTLLLIMPLTGMSVVGPAQQISNGSGSSSSSGSGISYCAPASASGTTYTCTPSPALTSYTAGTTLNFVPDVNGTPGAITVNANGLGAKSIKEADGSTNPVLGDLIAGKAVYLTYDGTVFRITPQAPSLSGSGGWAPYFSGTGLANGAYSSMWRMQSTCTLSAIAISVQNNTADSATVKILRKANSTVSPTTSDSINTNGWTLTTAQNVLITPASAQWIADPPTTTTFSQYDLVMAYIVTAPGSATSLTVEPIWTNCQ